ncbi:MAG: hypothetical protein A2Z25_14830 [Planctomycetes bacterium RBG_16_55_9]|nr:MAG: hypothetical protein A2Z25_14830 [Planctomycetes bacterium RBG_16_55_9]
MIIRQGKEQNYQPEVYVEPAPGGNADELADSLNKAVVGLQSKFPGLEAKREGDNSWHVVIPEECHIGHEAHFRKVMETYLKYLPEGRLPDWEVSYMLTKYYITTRALEMAKHSEP